MSVEPLVVAVVLVAAALHALWNLIVAGPGDRLINLALVMLGAGLVFVPLVPWLGVPTTPLWPWLALSTLLHAAYHYFLLQGYSAGDLSLVYPLARGSSPLWLALFAGFAAGEWPNLEQSCALALLCAGLIALAFARRGQRIDKRPIHFALIIGLVIGLYSLVDGLGARAIDQPLVYVAWQAIISAVPICIYVLLTKGPVLLSMPGAIWLKGLFGGAIAGVAYGAVLWAMTLGSLAVVSGLRETSIVIGVLLGVLVLKEQQGRGRLLAAMVVLLGALWLARSSL